MSKNGLVSPELPKFDTSVTNRDILLGKPIPAIDRVKLFSEEEFEFFTLEWLHGFLKNSGIYQSIYKQGGSGDMGRDVVAFVSESQNIWDNYQCKHYDNPLSPSQVWVEIGKLCYYCYSAEYSVPRKYYFICPKDIGTKLQNILKDPVKLKKGLKDNWGKYCKDKISNKFSVEMLGQFEAYVDGFDFSIFSFKPIIDVISEHKQTQWHALRFGGGLMKKRPSPGKPSQNIDKKELRYVNQLQEAYKDHLKVDTLDESSLPNYPKLQRHFNRQREYFYSAESLKEFERDQLPPNNNDFESLKEEIFTGIINIVESEFEDALERVNSTIQESMKITINSYILLSELRAQDKCGVCHHLVNENKISWV